MATKTEGFLRSKEICERLSIGRTTLWRLIQEGKFPQGFQLGKRIRVWNIKDVEAFEASMSASTK